MDIYDFLECLGLGSSALFMVLFAIGVLSPIRTFWGLVIVFVVVFAAALYLFETEKMEEL